ncbi:MAG: T9SS type A sorting domain-containing protein [Flavipsychrobacter sp.]|nr:T9SS type A sorting domain-containing protein [Flavipsychrobacter sp.]
MKKIRLFQQCFLLFVLMCTGSMAYAQVLSVSISATTATTVCYGNTISFSSSVTGTGPFTYQWEYATGSSYSPVSGGTLPTLTDAPAAPGTYRLKVTSGSTSVYSNILSVTVNFGPGSSTISATSTSICWGVTTTLTGTTVSGATYQWYLDGSAISSATSPTYITSSTLAGGTHTFNLHTINSTCNSFSNNLTVTVNKPTSLITSSMGTNMCADPYNPDLLSVPNITGNTYQWYDNGSLIPGAVSSSYVPNTNNPSTSYPFSVTVTDINGCSTTGSITLNTQSAPPVSITASGPTTFCYGNNITLTASNNVMWNYTWTDDINGSSPIGYGNTLMSYSPSSPSPDYYVDDIVLRVIGPPYACPAVVVTPVTTHYCGSCSPAMVFPSGQNYVPLGQTGTISGSVSITSGYVYLSSPTGTITITGNVYIRSAVVLVDAGTTIDVVNGGSLGLMYDHVFSCPGNMWQGIVAEDGSSTNLGGNIIEDAVVAFENKVHRGPGIIFDPSILGNVFNRNNTSIAVNSSNIIPIYNEGNVFTSRDISTYPGYPAPYYLLGDLRAPITTNPPFTAPFAIENNTYPYAMCKNGQPAIGISLYNCNTNFSVGIVTSSIDQTNIFDNMVYGVSAYNSNATITSCTFMNTQVGASGGSGVFVRNDPGVPSKVTIGQTTDPLSNKFYIPSAPSTTSQVTGVEGWDVNNLSSQNTSMVSDQSLSAYTSGTVYDLAGYYIHTSNFDSIDISNNTMFNLSNGIYFYEYDNSSTPATVGNINIFNNHFDRGGSNGFVASAIDLENSTTLTPVASGNINVEQNGMTQVYYGIYTYGFQQQPVVEKDNMIMAAADPAYPSNEQYGIYNEYDLHDTVKRNVINGDGALATKSNASGIFEQGGDGTQLFCNTVVSFGKAFYFKDCNYNLTWQGNNMGSYLRGLDIEGDGIGPQGSASAACDNTWASSKWDTYVEGGANPANSILYVQSGAPYQPTYNSGSSPYSVGTTIITGNPAGSNACAAPRALPSSVVSVNNTEAPSYTIFPDPGNGNMKFTQSITDKDVSIQVMGADGRIVHKGQLQFMDKQASLDISNVASGLYMVQLQDSKGNTFNMKYVLTK